METQNQDIQYLKDFFLNSNIQVDVTNFIYGILISAFLAFIVKKVYIFSSQTISNKEYFSELFIPLSVVTCLVITVIKFSLALSLGLVGALSIVRFRAAIKEPEELIYLFFIIGIGLAAGANQFLVAIISTIFISLILIFLANQRRNKINSMAVNNANIIQLEIRNKSINIEKIINELNKNCSHISLKSTNILNKSETYIFWIELKNKNSYTKFLNSMKVFSNKDLDISLYTSENIHE